MKKIIIADDEKKTLENTEDVLKEIFGEDLELRKFSNAEEVIDYVKENKDGVDAIITDMEYYKTKEDEKKKYLREFSKAGLSVVKETKKINPKIKVIVQSGSPFLDSAVDALQLGADYYIKKGPMNRKKYREQYVKKIDELLNQNFK